MLAGGAAACLCIPVVSPEFVGSFGGETKDIQVVGNYAYVALGYGGLYIFDVSTPDTPVFMGKYDTVGTAMDVFMQGNLAYMAVSGIGGLLIIDVSDPTNPVLVGKDSRVHNAHSVFVDGDLAYLTDYNNGFLIFDVSNPANPVSVGSCNTPINPGSIIVEDGIAYVSDSQRVV